MFDKLIEFVHAFWDHLIPFVIVLEYERGLMLRFGKFHRKLGPGFHWKLPLVEHEITHSVVPSTHHLSPQSLTTADNHACVFQVVVTWRVHDLKKLLLEVEDAHNAMSDSVYGIVTQHVLQKTWQELCAPDALHEAQKEIRARAFRWGIAIQKVAFSDAQRCRSLRVWQEHR